MMYVKHFVICKALCTCVWVTALIMVIFLSLWGGVPVGSGLGRERGSSIDSSWDTGWAGEQNRVFYLWLRDPLDASFGLDMSKIGSPSSFQVLSTSVY